MYLNKNNITDISALEKANFEKLEMLNLKGNKIEDKTIIEKLKSKIKRIMIWNW